MAKRKGESCISILFKMTILLTLLLAVIVGGVFFAYKKLNEFFNRGGTIVVPDFRGKHLSDVFKDKPEGLNIVRRDEKFDDKYPKDHVIAQYPEPGTVVRPNKKIQLSISLGVQRVQVPNLVKSSLREVELALLNSQLKSGNRSYINSDEVSHDRIINQSPLPSAEYGINKNVDLLISLGRKAKTYPLPNLAGITLDEARKKLKAWGFNVGRIYSKKDSGRAKFQIISTNPSPYSEVRKGTVVSLLISAGEDSGTAKWADLRKFELYSGVKATEATVNVPTIKTPGAIVSPPRILIADDTNKPVKKSIKKQPMIPPISVTPEKEMRFVMPDGFMPKEVKFIHISSQGRKQIYAGTHKPLDLVKVKVPIVPNSKVQIYINDVPIEERKVEP
jgi:beta-lactam-binding protein with PASTA domain